MTDNVTSSGYSFETQLELGELLLNLGRIKEARVELEKARELNEIGAYTTPDDDPARAVSVTRLQEAMARAAEIEERTQTSTRRFWGLITGGLLLALLATASAFILNRNTTFEARENARLSETESALNATSIANLAELRDSDATRYESIIGNVSKNNYDAMQTVTRMVAQSTLNAEILNDAATATAVYLELNPLIEGAQTIVVTATPDPNRPAPIPSTAGDPTDESAEESTESPIQSPPPAQSTNNGPIGQAFQVNTGSLNLRTGPSVDNPIFRIINRGELAIVIAVSADEQWYQVIVDGGETGWMRSDLLVEVDPSNPIIPPTAVAQIFPTWTLTPLPPTPTLPPEPTATLAPTRIPTDPPPTQIPTLVSTALPQTTIQPLPTQPLPTDPPSPIEPTQPASIPTITATDIATATDTAPEPTPEGTAEATAEPTEEAPITEPEFGELMLDRLLLYRDRLEIMRDSLEKMRSKNPEQCRIFEANYRLIRSDETEFDDVTEEWQGIADYYADSHEFVVDRVRPAFLSCLQSDEVAEFNFGLAAESIYDTLQELNDIIIVEAQRLPQ